MALLLVMLLPLLADGQQAVQQWMVQYANGNTMECVAWKDKQTLALFRNVDSTDETFCGYGTSAKLLRGKNSPGTIMPRYWMAPLEGSCYIVPCIAAVHVPSDTRVACL